MHSPNRDAMMQSRIWSLCDSTGKVTSVNRNFPVRHNSLGPQHSFVFLVAKALKKDVKLKPKLLSYLNHSNKSDYVVQWLLDVPSLEKLKKQLQEDELLLKQLQAFYGPIEEHDYKHWLDFLEENELWNVDRPNSPIETMFNDYDKYLRMKKKAHELERNLKVVLLKELDELIKIGNKQAADREKRKRKRKSTPKVEEKLGDVPKTSLEFAINYLRNEGSKIPFYKPNSRNANVKRTSDAVAWVLSNIIDVEQKNRNSMDGKMPEDIDIENPFDQFIADKIAGKALVGPMEKEVIPMLAYFIGPLLKNQLQELHELAVKLKASIKAKRESEPAAELMRKTVEKLAKGFSWKMNESETLLTGDSRLDFGMAHEMHLPDFDQIIKLKERVGSVSKEEMAVLEKLYNELNEYMLYLNGSIYYLQKTLFMRPQLLEEITEKVGMALIDKVAPEQLQGALEAFRNSWNDYFDTYELPTDKVNKELAKEKFNKGKVILENARNPEVKSFIESALDYPEIINFEVINKNTIDLQNTRGTIYYLL